MVIGGQGSSKLAGAEPDASERLSEIADILAAGLSRLEARKSSRKSAETGESSLHFTPDQSSGGPPCSAEVSP
jgi:hypothetical protein